MMNIIINTIDCLANIFRNIIGVKANVTVPDSDNCKDQPLQIQIESGAQLVLPITELASEDGLNDTSDTDSRIVEQETETDQPPILTTKSVGTILSGNETKDIESETSLPSEGSPRHPSVISVFLNQKAKLAPICDAAQSVPASRITADTVNIFLPGECAQSVIDALQSEEPVNPFGADSSKLPTIKEEKIPEEQARMLAKKNLLIKVPGMKAYYINPLIASFFHITDIESLNALDKIDDENIRMYRDIARFFHVDKEGELVFDADGKLGMLEKYLSRPSPKYDCRAARIIEETYGKEIDFESFETQTDENGGKIDRLILNVRSSSARCPACGRITTDKVKESGSSSRTAQDIPIHIDRRLEVEFHGLRQYRCQNPDCEKCRSKTAFIEQPDCLRPNQQRTKRLDALLLVCVIDTSFHGCERVMNLFGVKVGDDSIRKIIKNLNFPDDPNVTAIGVDDVADRKGVSYFTVIYALEDHRMLALLEGRDGVELEKWLDHHLSVNLICRDRASAYSAHIDEWARRHNTKVAQIADRFHLIQNYIDRLREICYAYLPKRIAFDKLTGEILSTVPNKVAQAVVSKPDDEEMKELDYDNSALLNEKGEPISITLSASPSSSDEDDDTDETSEQADAPKENRQKKAGNLSKAEKEAQEKRNQKYDTVCKIRTEYNPSGAKMEQYTDLGVRYKVSPMTVRKYVTMSQNEVELLKCPKHREKGPLPKEIDKYKYIIFKMLKDGHDIGIVFWYVKDKGYGKSDSNLIHYILDIYKIVFPQHVQPHIGKYIKLVYPDSVEVLTRSAILKYLVTVNSETQKNPYLVAHEKEFLEKYPKAKLIRDAFHEFHGVIMGKSVEDLEKLCNKPCALPELDPFFEHIRTKDKEAVSNAIRYSYSSGFVEGNNLRFKLLKRASYGRMRLSMLIQKCMIAFSSTLDNFQLGMIVEWIPLHENPEYAKEEIDNYLDKSHA